MVVGFAIEPIGRHVGALWRYHRAHSRRDAGEADGEPFEPALARTRPIASTLFDSGRRDGR